MIEKYLNDERKMHVLKSTELLLQLFIFELDQLHRNECLLLFQGIKLF